MVIVGNDRTSYVEVGCLPFVEDRFCLFSNKHDCRWGNPKAFRVLRLALRYTLANACFCTVETGQCRKTSGGIFQRALELTRWPLLGDVSSGTLFRERKRPTASVSLVNVNSWNSEQHSTHWASMFFAPFPPKCFLAPSAPVPPGKRCWRLQSAFSILQDSGYPLTLTLLSSCSALTAVWGNVMLFRISLQPLSYLNIRPKVGKQLFETELKCNNINPLIPDFPGVIDLTNCSWPKKKLRDAIFLFPAKKLLPRLFWHSIHWAFLCFFLKSSQIHKHFPFLQFWCIQLSMLLDNIQKTILTITANNGGISCTEQLDVYSASLSGFSNTCVDLDNQTITCTKFLSWTLGAQLWEFREKKKKWKNIQRPPNFFPTFGDVARATLTFFTLFIFQDGKVGW